MTQIAMAYHGKDEIVLIITEILQKNTRMSPYEDANLSQVLCNIPGVDLHKLVDIYVLIGAKCNLPGLPGPDEIGNPLKFKTIGDLVDFVWGRVEKGLLDCILRN